MTDKETKKEAKDRSWAQFTNFPKAWELPRFRYTTFRTSTSSSVVVIPVLNEGRRLSQLLKRMDAGHVGSLADVLIADGGSTDGSISQLCSSPPGLVRSILSIQEQFGLSSQLRAAYALCLAMGYKNIVTIDGNGKDDPVTIPLIIARLQDGHDFVQASRFLKGGRHENTPLIRLVAVRAIHAPILRIASGFPWTDTTQGFRGYSSRLLADKRLSIFRNSFVGYNLLPYLSSRAPRLGFRCSEVPSVRLYPKTGKIPTKITAIKGTSRVFWSLLSACLGRLNPK